MNTAAVDLDLEPLLTAKELAAHTKQSVQTLAQQRMEGRGIPYVTIGRAIRYKLSDVIDHIEKNTVRPSRD